MKNTLTYAEVIAFKMIKDKAPKAANEIGFTYDDGVVDQIEMALRNSASIDNGLTVERIEELVDDVIQCWKDDTQMNYPHLCS